MEEDGKEWLAGITKLAFGQCVLNSIEHNLNIILWVNEYTFLVHLIRSGLIRINTDSYVT